MFHDVLVHAVEHRPANLHALPPGLPGGVPRAAVEKAAAGAREEETATSAERPRLIFWKGWIVVLLSRSLNAIRVVELSGLSPWGIQ